jgi:ABC-2 type transport system ATP-binding protein
MLTLTNITKRFGNQAAVRDLHLSVARGQIVALTGPNGCGKTTTLQLCAGLLAPDAGTVTVGGGPPGAANTRRALAFAPDSPNGFDELTIRELLDLYASLHGARESARDRRELLLDAFGLANTRKRIGALSNGQRRAVAITAAASVRTPLLLIDEAAAALDPEAVAVLKEILRAHADDGAVLLASQDLAFSESVASQIVLLDQGECVAAGTPAELRERFEQPSLEGVFMAATGREGALETLRERLAAR